MRFSIAPVLTAALFAVLFLAATRTADAKLRVCNNATQAVYVAYAIEKDEFFDFVTETHGWYHFDVGECATVYSPDLNEYDTYYIYANGAESGTWSGSASYCVDPRYKFDFTDEYVACRDDSSGAYAKRGFRKIATGSYTSYTYTLTD